MKTELLFLVMAVGMTDSVLAKEDITAEQARRWVEAGEILPLDKILAVNRDQLAGKILDIELEYEDGQRVYEIKLLDAKGQRLEYYLDARTGELLKMENDD
ncbi:MAG: PepSY domain-containing protein [Pseudomonadales bacterium]